MELPFNKDNFIALQLAKTTSDERLAVALADLGVADAALKDKDTELATLKEGSDSALADAVSEVGAAFMAQTETRIKEAFAQGAQKAETLISMINADSDADASKVLLNAESSEPSPKGEGQVQVDPWAKILNKRKKG